ncbi:MAG: hypothetical protein HYZ53_14870 [Planctomycetes bacterium]|nr:hypothetical protein [Planctomycetota bacterium]
MIRAGTGALVGALLLTLSATSWAQSMEEKRDHKLQSEFLKKAAWFTDYDKARAEAKKTGKVIFAYFTRSYAP